jgi:hypothetical protein
MPVLRSIYDVGRANFPRHHREIMADPIREDSPPAIDTSLRSRHLHLIDCSDTILHAEYHAGSRSRGLPDLLQFDHR